MKKIVLALILILALAMPAMALNSTTIVASGAKVSACAYVSGPGSASAGGHAFGIASSFGPCSFTFADVRGGASAEAAWGGVASGHFSGCSFGIVLKPGFGISTD